MTGPPASPIPKHQTVLEAVRMTVLGGGLLIAILVFVIAHFWTGAIVVALIAAGCVATGAIGSPAQIGVARHPAAVTTVETTVWLSRNRTWITLGDDDPRQPAVELRSKGHARRMAEGRFPAKVAGRLEPGQWVVVQVGQLTLWPAGKVQDGLTQGAFRLRPEDLSLLRRFRVRGPGGPTGPRSF
jgi:hypothetical protein